MEGTCDASAARGVPNRGSPVKEPLISARLTSAGHRGNSVEPAVLGPDFELYDYIIP